MIDIIPCLLDANSIVKYYTNELGSDKIRYLFDESPAAQINITNLHIPEVVSVFHKLHVKKLISGDERDIAIDTFLKDINDKLIMPYICKQDEHFDKIYSNFYTVYKIPPPPKRLKYFWFLKGYAIELKEIADTNDVAMLTLMREIKDTVGESYLVSSDGHVISIAKAMGLDTIDPEKMTFKDIPLSLDKRCAKREGLVLNAILHDCETSNCLGSRRTLDISCNGACINLNKKIEKGKLVLVKLTNSRKTTVSIEIKSEVVWSNEESTGIRFREPSDISALSLL